MEHSASRTSVPPPRPQPAPAPAPAPTPGRGVCMMSTAWRDKQHPNLVNFIAAFLAANSYRINFLSISPDFIFNNGGLSVAFIFETMRNEREQEVQCTDAFIKVLTSIPGIDDHDANMLAQAIGSIEAIAKASKSSILENTDLSTDKAETIVRFFTDPQFYLSPKIN